jgi:cobalt/nickel transport system permease protein
MVGVHVLIGIGEGIITGLVVGAVLASRPDLVFGARDLDLVVGARDLDQGPAAAPAAVRAEVRS